MSQDEVLQALRGLPGSTAAEIAARIGLHENSARRALSRLYSARAVRREGGRGNAPYRYWEASQ